MILVLFSFKRALVLSVVVWLGAGAAVLTGKWWIIIVSVILALFLAADWLEGMLSERKTKKSPSQIRRWFFGDDPRDKES